MNESLAFPSPSHVKFNIMVYTLDEEELGIRLGNPEHKNIIRMWP